MWKGSNRNSYNTKEYRTEPLPNECVGQKMNKDEARASAQPSVEEWLREESDKLAGTHRLLAKYGNRPMLDTLRQLESRDEEVAALKTIFESQNVKIQFDKGGYRIIYHEDQKWCAFTLNTGQYIGDPQRFYPLEQILELIKGKNGEPNER